MSFSRGESQHTIFMAYILLAFTNLFWSLNFIIGKIVSGVVPPVTISFLRWLFPMLFFVLLNRRELREYWPQVKSEIPLLAVLGLTGYALNSICVYEAVRYTTTINTAFINAFNPVLIALAGYLMYRYPLTGRQGMGFLLSLVGVVTIIFKGNLESVLALHINMGDLFMVGSISSWAIHTVLYKQKSARLPVNVIFTMMMCSGVLISLPLALLENVAGGTGWVSQVRMTHLLGIFALNIFPSVLAYKFWNRALTRVSANEVAISQYLIPVFTTLVSLVFLDEKLHGFHLAGGGLIFFGVFLVTSALAHGDRR
jgi:drug/metabolite transporter (DMT)-like permease